jgi:hypothetical protein
MQRRRDRLATRWDRLNLEDRYEGPAIRFRRRWYLLVNRVERLDALLFIRWYRFLFGVVHRWERLAVPFAAFSNFLRHPLGGHRELAGSRATRPAYSLAPAASTAGRSGHDRRGVALVVGGLSLAIAATLILLPLLEKDVPASEYASMTDRSFVPEPSIGSTPQPETAPPADPSGNQGMYSSEQFFFSYPRAWDISRSGTATVLSDPDGQVKISFDTAPPGWLQQASYQVLEEFTETFVTKERIAEEVDLTPQGYRSLAVGGTALDASRTSIRFLVITIEGPDSNHALSVRFPADTAQSDLDAILGVVDSFRIVPA